MKKITKSYIVFSTLTFNKNFVIPDGGYQATVGLRVKKDGLWWEDSVNGDYRIGYRFLAWLYLLPLYLRGGTIA